MHSASDTLLCCRVYVIEYSGAVHPYAKVIESESCGTLGAPFVGAPVGTVVGAAVGATVVGAAVGAGSVGSVSAAMQDHWYIDGTDDAIVILRTR